MGTWGEGERRPVIRPAGRAVAVAMLATAFAGPSLPALADEHENGATSVWTDLGRRMRPGFESRLEYAHGWNEGVQKLELELTPELEIDLPFDATLTAIARARADGWDELEPGEPDQETRADVSRRGFAGDRLEAELRELTLSGDLGPLHYILGKQQIVWGQSDGLKVLDVVNPQSFREFILPDFDDSRIPLWSVNLEAAVGDWSLQAVWIPDRTYHEFVEAGSNGIFEFSSPEIVPVAPPGVAGEFRDPDRPGSFFEDSDAGARLSGFLFGWDLTLNYLYHYYDIPAFTTEVELRDTGPVAVVSPEYKRTHLVGATASNAFGDLTVRSELAFSSDRYFTTDRGDGVAESEEILYVVGLDWYGFRDALVSFQVFQSILTQTNSGLERDRVDTVLTLYLQKRLLRDTLLLEMIWLWNENHGDGLVRPRVTYDWNDQLSSWVGVDFFYGSRFGPFGQFDEADRVVVGMQWSIN